MKGRIVFLFYLHVKAFFTFFHIFSKKSRASSKANGEIDDLIWFFNFFRENELIWRWGDIRAKSPEKSWKLRGSYGYPYPGCLIVVGRIRENELILPGVTYQKTLVQNCLPIQNTWYIGTKNAFYQPLQAIRRVGRARHAGKLDLSTQTVTRDESTTPSREYE